MIKLIRSVNVFKNENLILQTALLHLYNILDLYSSSQIALPKVIYLTNVSLD